jgi:hypothetical protein
MEDDLPTDLRSCVVDMIPKTVAPRSRRSCCRTARDVVSAAAISRPVVPRLIKESSPWLRVSIEELPRIPPFSSSRVDCLKVATSVMAAQRVRVAFMYGVRRKGLTGGGILIGDPAVFQRDHRAAGTDEYVAQRRIRAVAARNGGSAGEIGTGSPRIGTACGHA